MCAGKRRLRLEHGAVEQDDGFGLWVRSMAKVVNVSVGPEATDDRGTRRGIYGMALGTDRYFAVVSDADAGLLAPDKWPPRTGRYGA